MLACDFRQCLSVKNDVVSKRKITVLEDHLKCNRHHDCNAVFPCKVCQTSNWSEKKRAMIKKMIESKKSEVAKKSATVTSLATEIPSVGNTDSRPVLKFSLWETEQSLGREAKWRKYDTEHFIVASW